MIKNNVQQKQNAKNNLILSKVKPQTYSPQLKPISLLVFSIFANQAYAQTQEMQFKQLQQCERSASTAQEKAACLSKQTLTLAEVTQLRADAQYDQAYLTESEPSNQKPQVLQMADANISTLSSKAPSNDVNTDSYANTQLKIGAQVIRTAEATDANPQGTSAAAKAANKALAKDSDNLPDVKLNKMQIRAKRFHEIGPMPGLGLTKEEIPGNVQSITAKEIKESHALSLTELMNTHLQSVNVNDYQSNPFQMDVTYRGFTASPQLGTAQGLSVFLDGIRVNEPFGDVVNWDMIPLNAINGLDVFPGSNPIFGLGTLGGALSMRTKSGFDTEEGTLEALGGSFNRKQFQGSIGGNNGVIAGFAAANIFKEDGWRDNSPSKVNQVFGKAEWRNDKLQLGLSGLYAGNDLIGNGLLPTETAQQDPSKVFTSPDETKNRLLQFQLSGLWDVSDNFNISAQVYKRKSKRNSLTTDVNEQFGGLATRRANEGEAITGGFQDVNKDGLPDYILVDYNIASDANGIALDTNDVPMLIDDGTGVYIANPASNGIAMVGTDFYQTATLANGTASINQLQNQQADGSFIPFWINKNLFDPNGTGTLNGALPDKYYQLALNSWNNREFLPGNGSANGVVSYPDPRLGDNHPFGGLSNRYNAYQITTDGAVVGPLNRAYLYDANFTDNNGFIHGLHFLDLIQLDPSSLAAQSGDSRLGKPLLLPVRNATGDVPFRNGADGEANKYVQSANNTTGYIDGTPTAIITKTEIDQTTDGGAIQFNWNLEHHKLMVGVSLDKAGSTYQSSQMLGLLDANHKGYLDPNNIGAEFAAATIPIALNDFSGDSITKSIYASETWSPIDVLHFNVSARYNDTKVTNKLATNNIIGFKSINAFNNFYRQGVLCPTSDPASCPAAELLPFTVERANTLGALGKGETDKFSYYSLNPAFGATWQVTPATNIYGNWNQGTRTPSVIELGCAFDDSPVLVGRDQATGEPIYSPRLTYERRFCTLPSTLSGDPYLKQVRSQTAEMGIRGYLTPDVQWNATAYNTDLKDDIYFVSVAPDRSFFQTVGKTKRQGLEFGVQGKLGKANFRVNYSLTDATFQDSFYMASPNNSSASSTAVGDYRPISVAGVSGTGAVRQLTNYQQIKVQPGDRIPGVPLHNLNANIDYDVTDKWNVGLTAVMHSSAFVRGNENNKHRKGPAEPIHTVVQCSSAVIPSCNDALGYIALDVPRPDFRYDGKTPGYATFNFKTTYKLDKGLTLGLQVNNIFDRNYTTAGRLGINPFSPSFNGRGAVSPVTGFNYNSNDWQSSNFIAPAAPRAAWVSLTYDFDLAK